MIDFSDDGQDALLSNANNHPGGKHLEIDIPPSEEQEQMEEGEGEEDMDIMIIETQDGTQIRVRKIQIEGEDGDFLMDDDGNIYDMEGNFVGTTNGEDEEN